MFEHLSVRMFFFQPSGRSGSIWTKFGAVVPRTAAPLSVILKCFSSSLYEYHSFSFFQVRHFNSSLLHLPIFVYHNSFLVKICILGNQVIFWMCLAKMHDVHEPPGAHRQLFYLQKCRSRLQWFQECFKRAVIIILWWWKNSTMIEIVLLLSSCCFPLILQRATGLEIYQLYVLCTCRSKTKTISKQQMDGTYFGTFHSAYYFHIRKKKNLLGSHSFVIDKLSSTFDPLSKNIQRPGSRSCQMTGMDSRLDPSFNAE